MDLRTERDAAQRQSVADAHFRAAARHNAVADLQAKGRQDIALLAVGVMDQGDARRAVRIVLNRRDFAGDPQLVALEVDDPVEALVAAAPVPRRDATLVVAPAGALLNLDERLLRLGAG